MRRNLKTQKEINRRLAEYELAGLFPLAFTAGAALIAILVIYAIR